MVLNSLDNFGAYCYLFHEGFENNDHKKPKYSA